MTGRGNKKTLENDSRARVMCALHAQGWTLQHIGDQYGITRERVRQILTRNGITRTDGGQAQQARERAQQRLNARNSRCLKLWGLTLDEYNAHVAEFGSASRVGTPMYRYVLQKKNARFRGIAWEFTFKEWWRIWQVSGKWDQRGRGKGYCMARKGDIGPYAPGNVYICTVVQNTKDSYLFKPYHARNHAHNKATA